MLWERIFDNQEETERFNGPKSVVGPFDKIRRAGKARRVESLSFSKIDMKTLWSFHNSRLELETNPVQTSGW